MAKKEQLSFLESIKDEYGEFIVYDELKDKELIKAISTGSLSLDISTCVGGIPLRRFSEIFGPESSGKTTLSLCVSKNAIKDGYKVLYIDVENTLDFSYAEAIIGEFDKSKFVLVQPETAEQAFEIAEEGIKSKEFGLIVFDSIGGLSPVKEKQDELTDNNVALVSRLLTKFIRRNAFDIRKQDVAFLFINQVRAKIGAYVPTFETPGGHALKHALSLRISLSKATDIEQEDTVIGINTRFAIKKNKVGIPFKSFMIPIMFGRGIDYYRDVVQFAETLGILGKRGAYFYFEDNNIGQGLVNTMRYLEEHKEILDKIIELCFNKETNKEKGQTLDEQ